MAFSGSSIQNKYPETRTHTCHDGAFGFPICAGCVHVGYIVVFKNPTQGKTLKYKVATKTHETQTSKATETGKNMWQAQSNK